MSKKPQTKAPISASGEEINGVFVDEQADAAMEYDPASPAPSSKKGGKKNDFVETKQTGKPSQLSNTKQNPSDADIKPNNSKPSNTNTSKNDTRPQSGKQANKQAPIQEQASSKAVTTPGNQRVQSNNQQNGTTTNAGSQKVMATSPTEAKNALANQAAGARSKLVSAWSMKMPDGRSIDKVMQEKWDSWTPNVRQGFMKRVREAVTAGVQKTTARKEWDQWKTTLKFVLEDLFEKSKLI